MSERIRSGFMEEDPDHKRQMTPPSPDDSDQDLVEKARSLTDWNDQNRARDLLLERYLGTLDEQIQATSRRPPVGVDPDEFAQMIWEKMLVGWPRMIAGYRGPEPLRHFLSVCVRNKSLDLRDAWARDRLHGAVELDGADERGELNDPNLFLERSGTHTPQEVVEKRDRNEIILNILDRIACEFRNGPRMVVAVKLRYMIPGEHIKAKVQPMIVRRVMQARQDDCEPGIVGQQGLFDGQGRLRNHIIADLLGVSERTVERDLEKAEEAMRRILDREYGVEGLEEL